MSKLYREITPLSPDDCFTVFSRTKSGFDFPLHCHNEFELNCITNAPGAKRVIGYHMGEIGQEELVLVGGNLPHTWVTDKCNSHKIHEITIQFHNDLFDDKFLSRNQLGSIRTLLQRSVQGILFSRDTTLQIIPRLESLTHSKGFESVLELLSVLQKLSLSSDIQTLSQATTLDRPPDLKSRRLEKVFDYIRTHYDQDITLKDISGLVNMPEVSFSRFFRKRTGKTFIDSLNELRMGHAARMLISTTYTVAEISYKCGYNNLSYFNRLFRQKNNCTPSEFRKYYSNSKIFI
jgi:AraC-like DNA-binding protein